MDTSCKEIIQSRVNNIIVRRDEPLHVFPDVPSDFLPWESNLSPSALYNCSLPLRKKNKIKTPETKWTSIKRWTTNTPSDIKLPDGVFYSIKRSDVYQSEPSPHFDKVEYALLLFPYGNVVSQFGDVPMSEDILFQDVDGKMVIEALLDKDAEKPISGYFRSVFNYMNENPDQIGIHLRRKGKDRK